MLSLARHLIPGHPGHLNLGREGKMKGESKEEMGVDITFPSGSSVIKKYLFNPVIQHDISIPNHKH